MTDTDQQPKPMNITRIARNHVDDLTREICCYVDDCKVVLVAQNTGGGRIYSAYARVKGELISVGPTAGRILWTSDAEDALRVLAWEVDAARSRQYRQYREHLAVMV